VEAGNSASGEETVETTCRRGYIRHRNNVDGLRKVGEMVLQSVGWNERRD